MENSDLNPHNKQEYPPMHTVEHLLNGTLSRMLGCGRAFSTHIERKKSKCDYRFTRNLTEAEAREAERRVNEALDARLPVTAEMVSRTEAEREYDLTRLPEAAGDRVRIVRIGEYDACPCIGAHVSNTGEVEGRLRIVSSDHDPETGVLRVRFKLVKD